MRTKWHGLRAARCCVFETRPKRTAREHRVERQCARVEDPRRERERDDDEPRGPHREGDDARVVREDVEEGEEGAEGAEVACA